MGERVVVVTGSSGGIGAAIVLGRLVTCDEVAGAVAYLADPECFTTGADVLLDGRISGVRLVQ